MVAVIETPPRCGQQPGAWPEPPGGADMDDDTKRRFVQVPFNIVQAKISPAAFRLWCVLAARANNDDDF